MPTLRSELIKTDVTAIEIISRFILVGIGNVLHVFSSPTKKCSRLKILNKHRIHGISTNQDTGRIVIFGNREFVVCSVCLFEDDISVTVLSRFNAGDWIWNAKLQNDSRTVLLLTANNILTLQNLDSGDILKRVVCPDKYLLFCGIIIGNGWHDVVIICGSMFRKILVWTPSASLDGNCMVLHTLQGHKGAIFSVFYHDSLHQICSTSDDRSVRIWKVNFPANFHTKVESWTAASIKPLITVYGHMSRVWKSVLLDDGNFISAGEDSQLRIWKRDGSPIYSWETHQGASIRSLAVCEQKKIIITGGKDGGLSVWPLLNDVEHKREINEITFSDIFGIKSMQDVPRRIRLTKLGNLVSVTSTGMVLVYTDKTWNHVIKDARFASYCLLEISPCRQFIALASIRGDVKIIREFENSKQLQVVFDGTICEGKIYSFQWFFKSRFITCSSQGNLEIWNLELNGSTFSVCKAKNFVLPLCKERWLTAAIEINGYVIVGDRDGSVHVFKDDIVPFQTFRRVHGRLGVSCISCNGRTELRSVGRDGFVRYWNVTDSIVEHVTADKLPIKWPVRITSSCSHGLLVLGFNEVNFEIWNLKEKKQLFVYKCGGGHRPWDFIIDQFAQFVYIKEKLVYSVLVPIDQIVKPSYLEGFHIRDVDCLRYLGKNMIISGGEDTTFRLSIIDAKAKLFTPVAIIRSHISSIRAITFVQINNFALVVSAGGRAQLKVWKIINQGAAGDIKYYELASHMLKPANKCKKPWKNMTYTYELEPRHMDVCIRNKSESDFLIYAAGSDAFWRIYSFNLDTRLLILMKEVAYEQYCILRITFVNLFHKEYIITMATDGKCSFWDANSNRMLAQHPLHQSGINSYDHTIRDDKLVLFTGGDDAVLSCAVFEYVNNHITICGRWKNNDTHDAQISGIRIVKNLMISVAADQKVVLWSWRTCTEEVNVQLLTFCHSYVADIHGCDVIFDQKRICVYGVGFELISWELEENDAEEIR